MRSSTLLALLSVLACGGVQSPPIEAARAPLVAPEQVVPIAEVRNAETMGVEGLHGSLSPRDARRAMEPQMPALTGCFAMHSGGLDQLSGRIRMSIDVAGDGRVTRAYPADSTMGCRDVERCVSDVVRRTRFPATQGGGDAHVLWTLNLDAQREPITWPSDRVERLVRRRGRRVARACGAEGEVRVTAYVARNGRVLRAGAASTEHLDAEVLDCVATKVRRWRIPGARRVSKVSFDLG